MPLAVRILLLIVLLVVVVLIGALFSLTRLPGSAPDEITVAGSPTVATQPIAITATPTSLGIIPLVPTNTSLLPQSDSGFSLVPTNTTFPTSIPSVTANTIVPQGTLFVSTNTPIPSVTPFVTANTRIPRGSLFVPTHTPILPGTPFGPTNTSILPQTASPEQFIRTYFDAINNRNYEYTWSVLSDAFKAANNGPEKGGYQGYVDYWNNVERLEVVEVRILEQSSQFAEAFVVANYHYQNGVTATGESNFHFVYDVSRNTWLFDVAR